MHKRHSIHAVVISWTGHAEKARQIAAQLDGHADRLTVIYSNPAGAPETGQGTWIGVDNSCFFGRKLAKGIEQHRSEDFLLIVQADAVLADWADAIRALHECAGSRPDLGVWTPAIDTSFYHARALSVATTADPRYDHVCQTDAIVLALRRPIIARLAEFDFRTNNLGWGIDKAANAIALATGHEILRDSSLTIGHRMGSGYDHTDAFAQMRAFLTGMTEREKILHLLLESSFDSIKRRHRPSRLTRLLRRFRRA